MSGKQSTTRRQEIYDKIRESSKDDYILSEMKRLGFWKEDEDKPSVTSKLITEEAELSSELRKLLDKQRKVANKEAYLKELRLKRMAESRQKQKETKERRAREKQEKAAKWKEYKSRHITYLGEGYSKELNKTVNNTERLKENGLPIYGTVEEIASEFGMSLRMLRFLVFRRKTSTITHYKRFYVNKKSGGKRLISAPMPKLKLLQNKIKEQIIDKVKINDAATGFVTSKSIIDNSKPHIAQDIVINLDLENFFPTITYERVLGMFKSLGYSPQTSTIFALACTEPDVTKVSLDNKDYYSELTKRYLPQGAPTSPAVTNIICRRLDARLKGMADKLNFNYSRYADDITFSAKGADKDNIKRILNFSRQIIKDENFIVNESKTKVMHKGSRQEVTGVVVNEKPSVNREKLRQFRALLHQIELNGPEGKSWNGKTGMSLLASIRGYVDFIKMVDPEKAKPYYKKVKAINAKYGFKHIIEHPAKYQYPDQLITSAEIKEIEDQKAEMARLEAERLETNKKRKELISRNKHCFTSDNVDLDEPRLRDGVPDLDVEISERHTMYRVQPLVIGRHRVLR